MFIGRDLKRTEADDFKLNVEPMLTSQYEAVPVQSGKLLQKCSMLKVLLVGM